MEHPRANALGCVVERTAAIGFSSAVSPRSGEGWRGRPRAQPESEPQWGSRGAGAGPAAPQAQPRSQGPREKPIAGAVY